MTWKPTANIKRLQQRAKMLSKTRLFFAQRNVLEVDTPILGRHAVTDPYIDSISVPIHLGNTIDMRYLQTSPEYSMKRLLAAGSGDIYQICKAFRHGEIGGRHNPEFTMLEWYRLGFDHHQLMSEIDDYLQTVGHFAPAEKMTYRDCFQKYLNIDPLSSDEKALLSVIRQHNIQLNKPEQYDTNTLLDILFSQCIEAKLGHGRPQFIFDYPAAQAALAKLNSDDPQTAARFELFIHGFEVANGFHELCSADEQLERFKNDQKIRAEQDRDVPTIDRRLIDALKAGLPECAGVALGIDRLLMIICGTLDISDIMAFPWKHA